MLQEGAALIFVTYSQLLDPPVRSANGLDDVLKGAVIVFDEVMVTSIMKITYAVLAAVIVTWQMPASVCQTKLFTLHWYSVWGSVLAVNAHQGEVMTCYCTLEVACRLLAMQMGLIFKEHLPVDLQDSATSGETCTCHALSKTCKGCGKIGISQS